MVAERADRLEGVDRRLLLVQRQTSDRAQGFGQVVGHLRGLYGFAGRLCPTHGGHQLLERVARDSVEVVTIVRA